MLLKAMVELTRDPVNYPQEARNEMKVPMVCMKDSMEDDCLHVADLVEGGRKTNSISSRTNKKPQDRMNKSMGDFAFKPSNLGLEMKRRYGASVVSELLCGE